MTFAQSAKGDSPAFAAKFHFATALQYLGETFAGSLHARFQARLGDTKLMSDFALLNLLKIGLDQGAPVQLLNFIGHRA